MEENLGEKDFVNLEKVGFNNLKMAFIFMLMCGLVFILEKDVYQHFSPKRRHCCSRELASQLMIIAALFNYQHGIQVTALGCLRGIQDVKIPSILTFIADWVITNSIGLLSLQVPMKMGALECGIALGIGLTISAVLLVIRFPEISLRKELKLSPATK